ncbi:hypothetical protein WA538_002381, partial [Blastocystis sp. DL]
MGKQLAQMHRSLSPNGLYGFDQDNYIGLSPQSNQWTESWCNFYLNHRLLPQIRLFESNGHCIQEKELFLQKARERLSSHNPSPSLLHGDLWGGNVGFIRPSTPVLFDPATYYGDRETDIIMTQSFGDFPDSFYQGYNDEWPLPDDYLQRRDLYDLYHVLNHANMFGGCYVDSVYTILSELIE